MKYAWEAFVAGWLGIFRAVAWPWQAVVRHERAHRATVAFLNEAQAHHSRGEPCPQFFERLGPISSERMDSFADVIPAIFLCALEVFVVGLFVITVAP